ncbi:MAG TPA: MFS transporter [Streptosporangiaceae bacterium]|jgi:predicted MFS family arabinose efflux permease
MTAEAAPASSGVISTWRQAPRAARALIVGAFVSRMAGFLQIFIVLYLTARGFPPAAAAGALTAYGAGNIAGLVAGGWLADRLGVRRAIMASMAASAVLLLSILELTAYPAIVLAVGTVGAVTQVYRPAAAELLSVVTPPDRQTMIFSMQQLALNIGATTAPLLGVVFIGISYRLLFVGEASAALIYVLIAAVVLPPDKPRAARAAAAVPGPALAGSGRRARTGYLAVLSDTRYLAFLAAMLLTAVVYAQYLSTLPLFLRSRGLPTALYGGLLALNSVVVIAGQLPVTRVVQHWQARTVVVTGVLLTGAGMCLYGPRWGAAGLVIATLSWSSAECVATPTTFFSYPARAAPAGLRGRYIGLSQASFQVGYAAGPVLGVLMWRHAGTDVWWACGAVSVAAALIAAGGVPVTRGRHAAAGIRRATSKERQHA